jgi:hypothetical protein
MLKAMKLDIFFTKNLALRIGTDTESKGYRKSSYDKLSFWPYQQQHLSIAGTKAFFMVF